MEEQTPHPTSPEPGNAFTSVHARTEALRFEQNLSKGIAAAVGAAIIGALVWALITVATGYQIGYMAVAVGFLVGYANRMFGKGIDPVFGYVGAACALLGCVLGNLFSMYGFVTKELGLSLTQAYSVFGLSGGIDLMKENFSAMDLLFYGIAVFGGYKSSFRPVEQAQA